MDDQANAGDKYDDHQIDEDLAEIDIDDKEFLHWRLTIKTMKF